MRLPVVFMVLGLLFLGMLIGAAASGAWLLAGGSLLFAVVIYGLVGTMVVLGFALLSSFVAERRAAAAARPLPVAE
jgi:4-hydroxybenzoate polyprenyltransferase